MTSRDFVQAEAENTDRIVLYREGLFWKAYERSAFAVCSQIRPFKPTKRSLKTLGGGELISIGFLTRTEDTVLAGLERLSVEPERLELRAASPIDVAQFEAWKASVPLAPSRPVRAAEPAPQAGSPAPSASVSASAGFPQAGAAASAHVCGGGSDISASSSVSACAAAAPASRAAEPSLPGGGTAAGGPFRLIVPSGGGAATGDPAPAYAGIPARQECDPVTGLPVIDRTDVTAARRVADALRRFDLADKTPMECMLFVSELKRLLSPKA